MAVFRAPLRPSPRTKNQTKNTTQNALKCLAANITLAVWKWELS